MIMIMNTIILMIIAIVLIVQILARLQYCNDQFHWSGPGHHVSEHKRYHPSFMIIITIDIWMMVPHFVIIIVL